MFYLLIALHQLEGLAFDVVLATYNVGEDWGQVTSIHFRPRDLNVEMTSILVFELKLYVILLYMDQWPSYSLRRLNLTPKLRAVLIRVLRCFFVSGSGDI